MQAVGIKTALACILFGFSSLGHRGSFSSGRGGQFAKGRRGSLCNGISRQASTGLQNAVHFGIGPLLVRKGVETIHRENDVEGTVPERKGPTSPWTRRQFPIPSFQKRSRAWSSMSLLKSRQTMSARFMREYFATVKTPVPTGTSSSLPKKSSGM